MGSDVKFNYETVDSGDYAGYTLVTTSDTLIGCSYGDSIRVSDGMCADEPIEEKYKSVDELIGELIISAHRRKLK